MVFTCKLCKHNRGKHANCTNDKKVGKCYMDGCNCSKYVKSRYLRYYSFPLFGTSIFMIVYGLGMLFKFFNSGPNSYTDLDLRMVDFILIAFGLSYILNWRCKTLECRL